MTKLGLLIGARLREGLRWARRHIYASLILAPLVLGITYATVARMIANAPPWRPTPAAGLALAAVAVLALTGLALTRAAGEIYHLRRPESISEAMPVPPVTHLHLALATRLGRSALVALIVLAIRYLLDGNLGGWPASMVLLVPFVALTASGEVLAALAWVHWGHTGDRWTVVLLGAALTAVSGLGGMLLLLVLDPGALPGSVKTWAAAGGAAAAAAMYALALWLHRNWRAYDIEYARLLRTTGRWSLFGARLIKRFGPALGAQLARDLQLTLRVFSSAVYIVLLVAGSWLAALFIALRGSSLPPPTVEPGWFSATWLPEVLATKVAAILISASLASLLPVLVAYQLPYLWLERVAGLTGLQIWQAKLWYARAISLPAPALAWLAAAATGSVPPFYLLPLLLESLFLWWMVGSFVGALSFEMPDRTGLALIVMLTFGIAVPLLGALLWPAGLIGYPYLMGLLTGRGRARAHYYLVAGVD